MFDVDYGNSHRNLNSLTRNLREFCMQHLSAMVICCRESLHARQHDNITGCYRKLSKWILVLKEIVIANWYSSVLWVANVVFCRAQCVSNDQDIHVVKYGARIHVCTGCWLNYHWNRSPRKKCKYDLIENVECVLCHLVILICI